MRAEHRMREVAVTPNILHILQAANPDMDMSQILNMMQMAWEADDPPIPHVHRGGPRPATADPFAPGNLAAAAILAHGQLLDTAAAAPSDLAALDGDARQPDDSATVEAAASAPQPHSAQHSGSGEGKDYPSMCWPDLVSSSNGEEVLVAVFEFCLVFKAEGQSHGFTVWGWLVAFMKIACSVLCS